MANKIHKIMQDFADPVTDELDEAGYFDLTEDQKKDIVALLMAIGLGTRGKLTKKLSNLAIAKNSKIWPDVWESIELPGLQKGSLRAAIKYNLPKPAIMSKSIMDVEPFVKDYYETHSLEFVTSLSETDIKRLRSYVWLNRDVTQEEFVDSLRNKYIFDGAGKRFAMIRRVELNRAEQGGEFGYVKQEGLKYKTWNTMKDNVVRPEHAEQEGLQIEIDEVFPDGEEWPGQYSINCRCWLTYQEEAN
jgi:hypothetical protein